MANVTGPTVQSMFNRIDRDHAGGISRQEVEDMVMRAGLAGVVSTVARDEFMKRFDGNRNGSINPVEFRAGLKDLIVKYAGRGDIVDGALGWFARVDRNGDGQMALGELQPWLRAELTRTGADHIPERAEAGAKILIRLLDVNINKAVDRGELESLAKDLDR